MASTVNTTIVVTRNGQAQAQNLPNLPYPVLLAVQAAASGALSGLVSMGILKAGEGAGVQKQPSGGSVELSFRMTTDHGDGGSSESLISYNGLSDADADYISTILQTAIAVTLVRSGVGQQEAGKKKD